MKSSGFPKTEHPVVFSFSFSTPAGRIRLLRNLFMEETSSTSRRRGADISISSIKAKASTPWTTALDVMKKKRMPTHCIVLMTAELVDLTEFMADSVVTEASVVLVVVVVMVADMAAEEDVTD